MADRTSPPVLEQIRTAAALVKFAHTQASRPYSLKCMKLVSIKFDRTFDVQRRAHRAGTWTYFGFETDGKEVYGVSVVGNRAMPVGQSLLVVVEDNVRWRKIYGWKNLHTGEVVAEHGKSTLIGLSAIGTTFLLFTVPLWFLNYPLTTFTTSAFGGAILAACTLRVAQAIGYHRRLLAAHKMLISSAVAHSA